MFLKTTTTPFHGADSREKLVVVFCFANTKSEKLNETFLGLVAKGPHKINFLSKLCLKECSRHVQAQHFRNWSEEYSTQRFLKLPSSVFVSTEQRAGEAPRAVDASNTDTEQRLNRSHALSLHDVQQITAIFLNPDETVFDC